MYEIKIIIVSIKLNLIMDQFNFELIKKVLNVICIHFVHVRQIETINVSVAF